MRIDLVICASGYDLADHEKKGEREQRDVNGNAYETISFGGTNRI